MYPSKNFIEKPIKLLSFDSFGHAILNQQAIDYIKSVPKPISILSIAGPYRTGKSYLLNCLISSQQKFQVGQTTKSCTKGLWIWGKPVTSVDESGRITNILVLDSQGFGSCEDNHDRRIIILALLLSTCFIYNSKGVIDADSIKDLDYVIQQTKKVKRQLGFDSTTDFHWILRDFHCQLVNELGLEISTDQYMQKSLKQFSDNNANHKQMHKLLCQFFRNRSCHTLVTPQTDPNMQQNPQFLEQLLKLKKILYRVPSLDLSGQNLAQVLQAYVSAMNEDFNQSGVSREGMQCQLRINCLSQLCKQMQSIVTEQDPQRRSNLIKNAMGEVEQSVISKMKSCKQIKILKQQINVMISQFDLASPPKTSKIVRQRHPRQSLTLPKTRQLRPIPQPHPQPQQKNPNKQQATILQRIRQQLQSKIHRYQLQLQDLRAQNKRVHADCLQLQIEKQNNEQKLNQLSTQLQSYQTNSKLQQLQLQQQILKLKKKQYQSYYQLQKQNKLLQQKVQYYEQKMAELELQLMELQAGIAKKYKQHIADLTKQNQQIVRKHQEQIREIKEIYVDKGKWGECSPKQRGDVKNGMSQFGQEIKDYIDKISQLQGQNSQLLISKMQYQHQISQLSYKHQQQQKSHHQELQTLHKHHAQQLTNIQSLCQTQLSTKDTLLQQHQLRLQQQRAQKQAQLQVYMNKYEQLQMEMNDVVLSYENDIKEVKEQWLDACERLEIGEVGRLERDREIERLVREIQEQRVCMSKSYNQSYQANKISRQQLLALQQQLQQLQQQNRQLTQKTQQLQTQLQQQQDQHSQHTTQLKSLHSLQQARLQSKLSAMHNTNTQLQKQLQLRQHQTQHLLQQQLADKEEILVKLKDRDMCIGEIKKENQMLRAEGEKSRGLVDKLVGEIGSGGREAGEIVDRVVEMGKQREQMWREVEERLRGKEKECYVMGEKMESLKRQLQQKQKHYQKSINDQAQQKSAQLQRLLQSQTTLKQTLTTTQQQLSKHKQTMSLLTQKLQHQQQLHLTQLQNHKDKATRQSHKSALEITRLELKLTKLQEELKDVKQLNRILQADVRETGGVVVERRKKEDRARDMYEECIRSMKARLRELEGENRQLKEDMGKMGKEMEVVKSCKEILENNYHEDFQLWAKKVRVLEQRRSAGTL